MKVPAFVLMMALCLSAKSNTADYKVLSGTLHKRGNIKVQILPDTDKYKVQMDYDVKKKDWVPVPGKLLKGKTVMEFPQEFRTEAGYQHLQKDKKMEIPKAVLKFVKRADFGALKNAYYLQVLPTNKKSKIDIVYHPSLPSVGWSRVKITFLSPFPLLDGYELIAQFKN